MCRIAAHRGPAEGRGEPRRAWRSLHRAAAARTAEVPWRHTVLVLLAFLAVFGAGVGLHLNERSVRERTLTFGAARAARPSRRRAVPPGSRARRGGGRPGT